MSYDASSGARIATFHAGLPKTGSSAIQKIFYDDHHKLAEAGVFYPRIRSFLRVDASTLPKQVRGGLKGGHMLVAQSLGGSPRLDRLDKKRVFGDLPLVDGTLAAFDASGCRRLLLSAESFAMSVLARGFTLPAAFHPMDRQVVLLFRRKDTWIVSRYKQQIKDYRRGTGSIRSYIHSFESDYLNYFVKCELMSKYVDTENVIAVDYEANKSNIAGALCAAIGRPDLYATVKPGTDSRGGTEVNVSLSNLASLFLLHCNVAVADEAERLLIRGALYAIDRQIVSEMGEIELLPPDLSEWAVSTHNAEVAQINARFGATLPEIERPPASRRDLLGRLSRAEIEKIVDALDPHLARRTTRELRSALPEAVMPD